MRLCIFIFLCVALASLYYFETQRNNSAQKWHVHPEVQSIRKHSKFEVFHFNDSHIAWQNVTSDALNFTLMSTIHPNLGTTFIRKLSMLVYEDDMRSRLSEIYEIHMEEDQDDDANDYSFVQRDIHLSPFRELVLLTGVDWNLGRGTEKYCWMGCRYGTINDLYYEEHTYTHVGIGLFGCITLAAAVCLLFAYKQRHRRKRRFY